MVEVNNVEVFDLDRAQRAIKNSFNVGEINTLLGDGAKGAKNLGGNMMPHQSHDAYLKGISVSFDLKGNGVFMPEFQRYHFIKIKPTQNLIDCIEKGQFTKYVSKETKNRVNGLYNIWKNNPTYENLATLLHNLPRGIETWYHCTTNYLQLKTIVIQRFNHKNKEDWVEGFIKDFCYNLPSFRELCGFSDSSWNI